jgi:O-antigen biosynthesis protein
MISRWTKFKDLTRLALQIIKINGFIFFLRSAYVEYKRNGFKILDREISLIEEFIHTDNSESYEKWLELSRKSDYQIYFENICNAENYPLDVVISNPNKNNELTLNTIHSIEKQTYPIQNMHLIKTSPIQKLKIKISIQSYEEIIKSVKNTNSKYVIFVKSGSILTKNALWKLALFLEKSDPDIVYCDEDQIDNSNKRLNPFFKPNWSPELFLSMDYFSNFFIVKKELLEKIHSTDILSNYDLLLRLTEETNKILHLPDILFSLDSKSLAPSSIYYSNLVSLKNALKRRKIIGNAYKHKIDLVDHPYNNINKITYTLNKKPKVSIIIPTKNNLKLLQRCIDNITNKTQYDNYEIIIIDNDNSDPKTLKYIETLNYKKIKFNEPFNFAKMNNQAASLVDGEFILFMNDDVAPTSSDWLDTLISVGMQKGVGIVGPRLIYSNNSIQHAGMIFSNSGAGYHPFQIIKKDHPGYFGFVQTTRNYSGVTGACLLIRKELFDEIDGFDENLDVYYNDADLCMKVLKNNYRIVYEPHAELLHEGSTTIKKDSSAFFAVENHFYFLNKWPKLKEGDPYYNPNLDWNFHIKTE